MTAMFGPAGPDFRGDQIFRDRSIALNIHTAVCNLGASRDENGNDPVSSDLHGLVEIS